MKRIEELIRKARGLEPVDLVLKNCRLINVLSREIYDTEIAISDDTIVGIEPGYHGAVEMDLQGMMVAPGFIDGHVHIESSMVEVPQFTRAVLPLGTTTVITDPHEIANVLGYEGIRYMMDSSKYNPLNVYFMLPSCVPATHLETSGSTLRAFDIFPFLREKWVVGLAEMMNYPGVLAGDADVLDKLKIARDKRIDGHAPGLSGPDLNAYIAAGVRSDHECTTVEEAREKLRKGMHIMIREGSATRNLRDLLPLVNDRNSRRFMWVTDDRHPNDILNEGHINYMIRTAIAHGLDPITAIQIGTINTAEYFRLEHLGAISPGRLADLVVIDDFDTFQIRKVFKSGKLVAEDGTAIYELPNRPKSMLRGSVNIKWLEGPEFDIPAKGRQARVIELVPEQIMTRERLAMVKTENGLVTADTEQDILPLYVVERHHGSGNIGKGLVHGFGLKTGAIASTVAHDSHNLIVVGVEKEAVMHAVVQVSRMGGGIAVALPSGTIASIRLPIAGLMSDQPLEIVNEQLREVNRVIRSELGATIHEPLMTLAFLALPVIPKLKLTDKGLVDVEKFDFVDLFVE